jgi:hypothetical protein
MKFIAIGLCFRRSSDAETFVMKEIVQGKDQLSADANAKQEVEEHLHRALMYPMKKYAARHHLLPDGRFIEDYYLRPEKIFSGLKYIGFTLNPEHVRTGKLSPNYPHLWFLFS